MTCGRSWIKAVMADAGLKPRAKAVAWALEDRRNNETGLCYPSAATLAADTGMGPASVNRAIRDLEESGWIARSEGRGRGRHTHYTFLIKGKIVVLKAKGKPIRVEIPSAENRSENRSDRDGKPITPDISHYKDEPTKEPKGRVPARSEPTQPRFTIWTVHAHKPDQVRAWNEWLTANGFPSLTILDYRTSDAEGAGWAMPFRWPPSEERWQDVATTKRFVRWQMSRKGIEEDARRRASA